MSSLLAAYILSSSSRDLIFQHKIVRHGSQPGNSLSKLSLDEFDKNDIFCCALVTTLGCCIPAWDERKLRKSSRNNQIKSQKLKNQNNSNKLLLNKTDKVTFVCPHTAFYEFFALAVFVPCIPVSRFPTLHFRQSRFFKSNVFSLPV